MDTPTSSINPFRTVLSARRSSEEQATITRSKRLHLYQQELQKLTENLEDVYKHYKRFCKETHKASHFNDELAQTRNQFYAMHAIDSAAGFNSAHVTVENGKSVLDDLKQWMRSLQTLSNNIDDAQDTVDELARARAELEPLLSMSREPIASENKQKSTILSGINERIQQRKRDKVSQQIDESMSDISNLNDTLSAQKTAIHTQYAEMVESKYERFDAIYVRILEAQRKCFAITIYEDKDHAKAAPKEIDQPVQPTDGIDIDAVFGGDEKLVGSGDVFVDVFGRDAVKNNVAKAEDFDFIQRSFRAQSSDENSNDGAQAQREPEMVDLIEMNDNQVQRQRKHFVVMLDCSASMNDDKKMEIACSAVITLCSELNDKDRVSFVSCNSKTIRMQRALKFNELELVFSNGEGTKNVANGMLNAIDLFFDENDAESKEDVCSIAFAHLMIVVSDANPSAECLEMVRNAQQLHGIACTFVVIGAALKRNIAHFARGVEGFEFVNDVALLGSSRKFDDDEEDEWMLSEQQKLALGEWEYFETNAGRKDIRTMLLSLNDVLPDTLKAFWDAQRVNEDEDVNVRYQWARGLVDPEQSVSRGDDFQTYETCRYIHRALQTAFESDSA